MKRNWTRRELEELPVGVRTGGKRQAHQTDPNE